MSYSDRIFSNGGHMLSSGASPEVMVHGEIRGEMSDMDFISMKQVQSAMFDETST